MDFAEEILIELFKEKKLKIIIRVPCIGEQYRHFITFNSLKEYYKANSQNTLCDQCDSIIEWDKAVVGFKRGIYSNV
ncbi:hypothetical protein GI584_14350 [Gracilibacillus salitolerans]|uniref:Uncharacterized protein n=1 Tax=Gracilibacillus salitolerans TaxID=2663022 RepID=A0A5Q2TMD8_9BACI|nr:hypothetical protein GI584_14350 [Gracilibacillus salitolerans]